MLTVVGLCSQSDSGNLRHEIYMSLAMANSVLELWEWRMDSQQGLIRLLVGRSVGCYSIRSLRILRAAQTKRREIAYLRMQHAQLSAEERKMFTDIHVRRGLCMSPFPILADRL